MKLRTLVAVGATLLTLAGAGCSSDVVASSGSPTDGATSPATGTSDTPDPCQLLTVADLKAATGIAFEGLPEEVDADPPGRRSCHFLATSDADGPPVDAWVTLFPTTRTEFDSTRESIMALPKGLANIDGVGENAYGDANSIRLFHAPYYIEVQVSFVDLGGTETIVALAQTVLSRLP